MSRSTWPNPNAHETRLDVPVLTAPESALDELLAEACLHFGHAVIRDFRFNRLLLRMVMYMFDLLMSIFHGWFSSSQTLSFYQRLSHNGHGQDGQLLAKLSVICMFHMEHLHEVHGLAGWYYQHQPFLVMVSNFLVGDCQTSTPRFKDSWTTDFELLDCGKRSHNYGTSPCLMGKSTISTGPFSKSRKLLYSHYQKID